MAFLLAVLCFGSTASAAYKRVWDCQIAAKLSGNGQHFVYYGQDAWNGDGSLYCESGNLNVFRTIAVSFNSMSVGFGADHNSVLQVLINLSTRMDPDKVRGRAIVNDRKAGPKVQWKFSTQLNEADVYITAATPATALRSLQRGTLFIRSLGD